MRGWPSDPAPNSMRSVSWKWLREPVGVPTPGTIDSDYRGEVKVILANLGTEPFTVTRGMRIAQLVIAPVVQARISLRDAVDETARGAGGFGSTGTA